MPKWQQCTQKSLQLSLQTSLNQIKYTIVIIISKIFNLPNAFLVRREMSLKDRALLKKKEYENKYFLVNKSASSFCKENQINSLKQSKKRNNS